MDGNVGFHAILRRSYSCFIKDLAKQRKQLIRQHLNPVKSPYSQVCYETDLLFGLGSNSTFSYQTSCLDFSDQENMPPVNNNNKDQVTYMTVPDQPTEHGNFIEGRARKRHPKILGENKLLGNVARQSGLQLGSTYNEICSYAAQHFARIREVLVERSLTTALNSGFLTPCCERLMKFMDMFVAHGEIDILQNERDSLQKRQKMSRSCLAEFKSVATSL
ncbi:putative Dynamin superfamily [Helianthus annuus]|nr:putative Dynamin superfamily [Helianthus annuus]KAJ0880315.1 putative Dynamin superfamily [Helianthus annuus]